MQTEWISGNLEKLIFDKKLQIDIMNNHQTFLTCVSNKGTKVDIFQLTNEAKNIKKIEL